MQKIKNIEQVEKILEENNVEIKDNWVFYNFWQKVDIIDNKEDCWNWLAGINWAGYGTFRYSTMIKSHRMAYVLSKGIIPGKLQVQHICNNRRCCNPNHLELGDQSKNTQYAVECNRWPDQFGENNGNSKLTDDEVRKIHRFYIELRKLHPGRYPILETIAKKFGIHFGMVSLIVRGKCWHHIYKEFHNGLKKYEKNPI